MLHYRNGARVNLELHRCVSRRSAVKAAPTRRRPLLRATAQECENTPVEARTSDACEAAPARAPRAPFCKPLEVSNLYYLSTVLVLYYYLVVGIRSTQ